MIIALAIFLIPQANYTNPNVGSVEKDADNKMVGVWTFEDNSNLYFVYYKDGTGLTINKDDTLFGKPLTTKMKYQYNQEDGTCEEKILYQSFKHTTEFIDDDTMVIDYGDGKKEYLIRSNYE